MCMIDCEEELMPMFKSSTFDDGASKLKIDELSLDEIGDISDTPVSFFSSATTEVTPNFSHRC